MNTVTPFHNAGPLCSEFHGGNCPDPDTCVYRNDDALPLASEPWADYDPYLAGYRKGLRGRDQAFRSGRFVGFCVGVLSVPAAMAIFWVTDWILREWFS